MLASFASSFALLFAHLHRVLAQWWIGQTKHLGQSFALSAGQQAGLRAHVYRSVDASWLDANLMHKFWNRLVQHYPLWLCSNVLTLAGLVVNVGSALVVTLFSDGGSASGSGWVYAQAAISLFLYQTLDATDGKQSYRSGQSTPLEELFDHGMDAMSTVLITLNLGQALRLEPGWLLALVLASCALFYVAQWDVYNTGVMRFAKVDVTEAQLVLMGFFVTTAILGPETWEIPFWGVPRKQWIAGALITCAAIKTSLFITATLLGPEKTFAGTSTRGPLLPVLFSTLPYVVIYAVNQQQLSSDATAAVLLCVALGAQFATTACRLIMAHMSKTSLRVVVVQQASNTTAAVVVEVGVPVAVGVGLLLMGGPHWAAATLLLWAGVVISVLCLAVYYVAMCLEICAVFQIRCFRLSKVLPAEDAVAAKIDYSNGCYNSHPAAEK